LQPLNPQPISLISKWGETRNSKFLLSYSQQWEQIRRKGGNVCMRVVFVRIHRWKFTFIWGSSYPRKYIQNPFKLSRKKCCLKFKTLKLQICGITFGKWDNKFL
jgi:hypothetical protein